jgi:hypothetical protein
MGGEEEPAISPEERLRAQIQPFLDEWFYRVLASPVGKMWTRSRTMALLLNILAMVGIDIAEEARAAALKSDDDAPLVEAIMAAMPGDIREKFEATALQVQTVLHEATRILSASEAEGDDEVANLFEEAGSERGGLTQQVLKASVVHAAKEVSQLRRIHQSWRRNTDERIDRLLRATEEAEHLTQQLLAAESQLGQYKNDEKEKSKSLLVSMANGQDSALVHSVFSTWFGYIEKVRAEQGIRKRFEDQIVNIETKLIQFKEAQIANVRGVIMRGAMEETEVLMHFVWKTWYDDVQEHKAGGDTAAALKALQDKMANFEQQQKENAGKFMTRMAAGSEASLTNLCLEAWIKFHQDYAADREQEEALKEAERKFKEHMNAKKDDAQLVLGRMLASSDNGLLAMMIQKWVEFWKEEKQQAELEYAMQQAQAKFKTLNGKQKGAAHGMQNRVNEQMNANIMQRVFNNWLQETKTNLVESKFNKAIESKRRQLAGVQNLFKSFAMQLEQNLGGDDDSSSRTQRRNRKSLQKGAEGSVSLPDIHQKGAPVAVA